MVNDPRPLHASNGRTGQASKAPNSEDYASGDTHLGDVCRQIGQGRRKQRLHRAIADDKSDVALDACNDCPAVESDAGAKSKRD